MNLFVGVRLEPVRSAARHRTVQTGARRQISGVRRRWNRRLGPLRSRSGRQAHLKRRRKNLITGILPILRVFMATCIGDIVTTLQIS